MLPNGIRIGIPFDKALEIDPSLKYNDEYEDYDSKLGYRVENNLENNTILSISIFIKETLNDEKFFKYEW